MGKSITRVEKKRKQVKFKENPVCRISVGSYQTLARHDVFCFIKNKKKKEKMGVKKTAHLENSFLFSRGKPSALKSPAGDSVPARKMM